MEIHEVNACKDQFHLSIGIKQNLSVSSFMEIFKGKVV
ncbi:hypothetical protein [Enterococcus sp. 4G2_DIV0659]